MAIEKAQLWMQKHSHVIPALAIHHNEIIELLENEHQAHNLVQLAIRDPGLSLELLIKVNSSRKSTTDRDPIESPQSAISLLGEQATRRMFENAPVAEKQLQKPNQFLLFQQIINRSFHNEEQTEKWAQMAGYTQIEPIKLAGLLAYTGELLCCTYDFDNYQKYFSLEHNENNEEKVFGFKFDELTLSIAKKFNLPSLMLRAIPIQDDTGQRAQLIKFLSLICKYCQDNWYSDRMLETQQKFAEYLRLPLDKVVREIHQNSVQAARNTLLKDSWHAAARLILMPDIKKPESTLKAEQESNADSNPLSGYEAILNEIKALLKNPKTGQSQILNSCMHGLHNNLGLTRVSLLLISKDRETLQSRMNIGLNPESPLKHFKIATSKAGLLKALLSKPQAIWINTSTFAKYHKMIPQSFLASTMTNNFFAMSLFINNKAIGLIYADRDNSTETLNKELFEQFKHTVVTSSKALTLLSKKHTSK
jgi:HD-like signal output (HDOD) protein